MDQYRHCQVVTTTDSREAAQQLARSAVDVRAAACAQVVGPITSIYPWEGKVETAEEWQIIFKTTADRYNALETHLREHHTYEMPEILCTPVIAGNPAYLEWLTKETSV